MNKERFPESARSGHSASALRHAEQRFRLIMENLKDFAILVLDSQGRVVDWNKGTERLLGYRADEILGQNYSRFFTPEDNRAGLPSQNLHQAATTGDSMDDNWLMRKDGSRFWASGATTALRDESAQLHGFVKVLRDLTQLKETTESLQTNEKRFRAIIERSSDGVFLLATDGSIQYASPSTTRLLGYPPEELVGRNAFDLMHAEDMERARGLFSQVIETPGKSITGEFRNRCKDGSWRWFEGTGTNMLAQPEVGAIIADFHDITERKRLEETLHEKAEQLADANRYKDEFLAMLSHELRNPLAAAMNGMQILRQAGHKGPLADESMDLVMRQLKQITRLTDDLRDLARIARGQLDLRKEIVDLNVVAAHAVESCRPAIDARGHKLSVLLPKDPLRVKADPARLEQVLGNLLINAANYTELNGQIELRVERDGKQGVIRVLDSGIGIPAQELPRIFDLFRRGNEQSEGSADQLGIGLNLVKRLVELNGGTVDAFSEGRRKGSEFQVRFPLVSMEPEEKELPPPAMAGGRLLRILVIEDNEDVAKSLAGMLRLWGHDVRMVREGPKALKAAQEHHPEVILVDLSLPGLDGFQIAGQVRQDPDLCQVPLIALTGFGQDEDLRRTFEAGFDQHLTKPVDPNELRRLLAAEPATVE